MLFFWFYEKIVLCIASSKIAAFLFPEDCISHLWFKIPLNYIPNSICYIPCQSYLAQILCQTSLIIWDKIPIQHKDNFAVINLTLKDLYKNEDYLFGGISVILEGDFTHIFLVVL